MLTSTYINRLYVYYFIANKTAMGLSKTLSQLMDLSSPCKLYTYNNDNKSRT